MLKQTSKVRDSCGKGFDSESAARDWVDGYIITQYPAMLEDMKARVELMEAQLQGARARVDS